jgi:hypothetical protein
LTSMLSLSMTFSSSVVMECSPVTIKCGGLAKGRGTTWLVRWWALSVKSA